jgi:predicted alpha-1,6-mannanase (GH76 family)
VSWSDHAAAAQRVLVERFWDGRRGLFRVDARRRIRAQPHWHYWWQAHALDVTVDAFRREQGRADETRELITRHITGVVQRNGGRIINDYYDDMAWMGLALLRAEGAAGPRAGTMARELWSEILGGWDTRHGGVAWRRGDTYTNAPANGPSAILGARLYARDDDRSDLDRARLIDDWLHATLVDPDTALVWDGVHPGAGLPTNRDLYTYNQGTVVGSGVELYRTTGDTGRLHRAGRTARAALAWFASREDGLPPAEGAGDAGLFKGILARYLGEFVLAVRGVVTPAKSTPEAVAPADVAVRFSPAAGDVGALGGLNEPAAEASTLLRRCGELIAPTATDGLVGPDWASPTAAAGSLSSQLAAVTLLETLARLEAGRIE